MTWLIIRSLAGVLAAATAFPVFYDHASAAQGDATSVAGVWKLDAAKSQLDEQSNHTVTITATGPEVKIVIRSPQTGEQVITAFTDGRSGSDSNDKEAHPMATWNKNRLVVKSSFTLKGERDQNGNPVVVENIEEWEVSKDGKTLKRKVTVNNTDPPPRLGSRPGELEPGQKTILKFTLIYNRVSAG